MVAMGMRRSLYSSEMEMLCCLERGINARKRMTLLAGNSFALVK